MTKRKPNLTYKLHDGRVLSAVTETYQGYSMVFIKHGETYLQVEQLASLVFFDEALKTWLQQFNT